MPHYRSAIYNLISEELPVDIYAGDTAGFPIKLIAYPQLKGFKRTFRYRKVFKSAYILSGASLLSFKNYNTYLITGAYNCISTWLILAMLLFSQKKVYLWSHGFYGGEGKIKNLIKKIYFGMSSGVLLYGQRARKLMIENGFSPAKLHVIYNSIDWHNQKSIRMKLKQQSIYTEYFKEDLPTIIFVGRIQKVKKIELLIDALVELSKSGTRINLIIVGDGSHRNSLADIVLNLGLKDNVYFYGSCYDEEKIGRLIFNADIFVSPGNVGLAAIHSLSYGTPVITHDNFENQMPEFEAIDRGVTGDFFKEDSISDLCQLIMRWINKSPEERNKIREACYQTIDQKYNPIIQIELLKSLLNSRQSA